MASRVTLRTLALVTIALAHGGVLRAAAATTADDGRPSIGGAAPLPALRDPAGQPRALADLKGRRGLVILFWAGWSDRSVEELKRLDAAAADLAAHGVTIAAVNVDRFSPDEGDAKELRDLIGRLHPRVTVLVDRGLELFHAYGVVTVPSTAVVDERGRLSYFLYGYSHEQREALFDAIDATAGIVRQHAAAAATAAVVPAALRRLQLGRLQLQQGHADAARSSFELAAQADARFADPLVELAALAIDSSDRAAARELLDRAAAVDQRNAALQRERTRLTAIEAPLRPLEAAEAALTDLARRDDAAAAGYLGYLLWAAGDGSRAERAFERAKELSDVDPRACIAGERADAAAAWSAMTRYRRQVASVGR